MLRLMSIGISDVAKLHIVAAGSTVVRLSIAAPEQLLLEWRTRAEVTRSGESCTVELPKGRHVLNGASLTPPVVRPTDHVLERLLAEGRQLRDRELAAAGHPLWPTAKDLSVAFSAQVAGNITDLISVPSGRRSATVRRGGEHHS